MYYKLWIIPSVTLPIILISISFLLGDAAYNNATDYAVVEGLPKYLLTLVLFAMLVLNLIFILFAVRRVGKRKQVRFAQKTALFIFAVIGVGFFFAVNIIQPYLRSRPIEDNMGGCTPFIREDRTEALCEELTQ